ncbi:MAG: hypothetical protein FJX76_22965 [Armatimonadetes bacterium]|nr:hypothetical protein [Armatimonadota bacterium]
MPDRRSFLTLLAGATPLLMTARAVAQAKPEPGPLVVKAFLSPVDGGPVRSYLKVENPSGSTFAFKQAQVAYVVADSAQQTEPLALQQLSAGEKKDLGVQYFANPSASYDVKIVLTFKYAGGGTDYERVVTLSKQTPAVPPGYTP